MWDWLLKNKDKESRIYEEMRRQAEIDTAVAQARMFDSINRDKSVADKIINLAEETLLIARAARDFKHESPFT